MTAVERVTGELRERILAGELPPGDRLRETALVQRYGVARHTVRAALRALAAERLVTVEPHRGAHVTALDAGQVRALAELRTALEIEAARMLAAQGLLAPPWPAAVAAAATALDAACSVAAPDRAAVDAAHAALHHALVAAADSPRITAAHAALAAEGRVVLLQSRAALPVERMAAAHHDLLERLAAEGPEALRGHLREGARAGSPQRAE